VGAAYNANIHLAFAQWTLPWQPILEVKSEWKLPDVPSFIALAFSNVLQYRNADTRVNSGMNWPTSCENLVRFGAKHPEFTRLECICQHTGPIFTKFSGLADM